MNSVTTTELKWPKALAVLPLAGAAGYAAYAAHAWWRFGRARRSVSGTPLDRFVPEAEVDERHSICVPASAEAAISAVLASSLADSPLVRGIVRIREFALGVRSGKPLESHGSLLEEMEAMGWVRLDESGHEFTMGAVTRPWEGEVVFRSIPAAEFPDFAEPGYVKIAWTIRVRAAGPWRCRVETETRAAATDEEARRRFRRYWAMVSPGIRLIRRLLLLRVRREAFLFERKANRGHRPGPAALLR